MQITWSECLCSKCPIPYQANVTEKDNWKINQHAGKELELKKPMSTKLDSLKVRLPVDKTISYHLDSLIKKIPVIQNLCKQEAQIHKHSCIDIAFYHLFCCMCRKLTHIMKTSVQTYHHPNILFIISVQLLVTAELVTMQNLFLYIYYIYL